MTLYLYQLEEDNQGGPSGYVQVSRDLQRMPPGRFNLRYLVTAHSKAPAQLRQADQHRMLGAAIQLLRDHPVIDRKYLAGSLIEQNEEIHILLEKTNLDQLIKIWNNTSVPLKLSFVVMLTGVTIDSKRERRVGRVTEVEIGTDQRDIPRGGA